MIITKNNQRDEEYKERNDHDSWASLVGAKR